MLMLLLAMVDTPEQAADLTRLYEKYEQKIYGLAYRILKNKLDAEETVLDTFEYLITRWQSLDFSNDAAMEGYLYKVAYHKALDRKRRVAQLDPLPDFLSRDSEGDPAQAMERDEARRRVADLIRALPDDVREVVILSVAVGMPKDEIAALLGKSRATVYRLLAKGKGTLQKQIEKEGLL